MGKVLVGESLYTLPVGGLYLSRFKEFIQDNVLDYNLLSSLEIVEQYNRKKELFDYVCNSLTLLNDEEHPNEKLTEICSNMWRVDNMINYLAEGKRYELAIEKMDKFMFEMFELSNEMLNSKIK